MDRQAKNPQGFVSVVLRRRTRRQRRTGYSPWAAVFTLVIACLTVIVAMENLATAVDDQDAKAAVEKKKVDSESSRSRPDALKFRILRRDNGEPVANAKVRVQMWGNKQNLNPTLTTDTDGIATFPYPDGTSAAMLAATVTFPGLVPYYANFGREIRPELLPTQKEIRMETGKLIGGTVCNPQGEPISGVRVSIHVPATDSPSEIHYSLLDVSTGDDGRWSLDGAPINLAGISVNLRHPQFIKAWLPVQDKGDGRYQLDPGLTLTGRVVDQAGNPVATAHITIGRDRWGSVDAPTHAKADGSYTVYALSPEATFVTVEAPTFAPQTKSVVIGPNPKPVDFELAPGKTTSIHVVNTEGEPISGVRIVADTWKTLRPLWWDARTNAEGNATWNGAPDEPVKFHLLANGYAAERNAELAPQEEPHTVVMYKPLRIDGIVTNTQSQKIAEFRVGLGRKFNPQTEIHWMSYESLVGGGGKFEVNYSERCEELFVKIEAKGYRPWISKGYTFEKSPHRVFVKLEPAEVLSVTVLTPDGSPASGARLYRSTKAARLMFRPGFQTLNENQNEKTNDQGQIEVPVPDEPTLFVAIHDSGYAEITGQALSKSQQIPLQAWSQVEVTISRAGKPLPNTMVEIYPQTRSDLQLQPASYGLTGISADDGRITFQRVVPGKAAVRRILTQPLGNRRTSQHIAQSRDVDLQPGELTRVDFGKAGTTVTGQIKMNGTAPADHDWKLNRPATIMATAPRAANAQNLFSSIAARLVGQPQIQPNQQPQFLSLIADDGTFAVDDLPPGTYTLRIDVTAVPKDNQWFNAQVIGKIEKTFEVTKDQPTLDLGTIEGTWNQQPEKGE